MAVQTHADRRPTWKDPEACPFCGSTIADGGPAFVDHVRAVPACKLAFDTWRGRVAEDIAGGWSG